MSYYCFKSAIAVGLVLLVGVVVFEDGLSTVRKFPICIDHRGYYAQSFHDVLYTSSFLDVCVASQVYQRRKRDSEHRST